MRCSLQVYGDQRSMATQLVVSAPGKVILHGEHAVVYGKAALATSVDLRCYLALNKTTDHLVTLDLPDFDHHIQWSLSTLTQLPEANEALMVKLKELSGTQSEFPPTKNITTLLFLYLFTHICKEKLKELQGLHTVMLSTLPASAGLGSSAAFSVALSAGFLSLVGTITSPTHHNGHHSEKEGLSENAVTEVKVQSADFAFPQSVLDQLSLLGIKMASCGPRTRWNTEELEIINNWGLKAEKLTHGTPSGIDNSISTFGGAIRFCSGEIHHLQRMPRLRILLVNTKVPRSTKKMVTGVRELHSKYPNVVDSVLDAIEAITERAERLFDDLATPSSTRLPHSSEPRASAELTTSIHASLRDLCIVNQHLLNALGVGHAALDRVCAMALERGLAAKLTGAGGGGCALVLVPPNYTEKMVTEAVEAFSKAGFDCWETTIGSAGVTAHSIS